MKTLLSFVALASALLVTGMAPSPASAQSSPEQLPAAIAAEPHITYSWGVLVGPADDHQVAYTWDQLRQWPNMASAPAQSKGVNAGSIGYAARDGAFIEGQPYIAYSWGVVVGPSDDHQVSYTWEELDRRNGDGVRN